MDWLQLVITGLSIVAAILAWVAKLRWSKEYSDAKEATIAAKDAQIQVLEKQIEDLRDLTPMKLREYLLSIKLQLEEYNEALKCEVEELTTKIAEKDNHINVLNQERTQRRQEIAKTELEKSLLSHKVAKLEDQLRKLKPLYRDVSLTSQCFASWQKSLQLWQYDVKDIEERLNRSLEPNELNALMWLLSSRKGKEG